MMEYQVQWKVNVLFLFITTIITAIKLTSYLNPGCEECEGPTLVYTRCDGARDSVHQLWDLTNGQPTVIIAVTDTNSTLTVRWHLNAVHKFAWSSKPTYSFAVSLTEIIEYEDINDTATWSNESAQMPSSTGELPWRRVELIQKPTQIKLKMNASRFYERNDTSSISVELELLPSTEFSRELPHLVHSGNSSLMTVSLANCSRGAYNSSRFALRFVLVSTDDAAARLATDVVKSLDDEHTPGIFKMVNLATPESLAGGDGGFVQFRPVAYTAPVREVTASTVVSAGEPQNMTHLPYIQDVLTFYRGYPREGLLKSSIVISLGGRGDGFYTRTNYTAWALTVGYGAPPAERFSLAVLLVIGIGLSVPVALLLGGGVYALACRRRGGHQRLRD